MAYNTSINPGLCLYFVSLTLITFNNSVKLTLHACPYIYLYRVYMHQWKVYLSSDLPVLHKRAPKDGRFVFSFFDSLAQVNKPESSRANCGNRNHHCAAELTILTAPRFHQLLSFIIPFCKWVFTVETAVFITFHSKKRSESNQGRLLSAFYFQTVLFHLTHPTPPSHTCF